MIITAPSAGAAIVRQWATDRAHFLQVLAQLEPEDICQMAQAAVAFHRRQGSDLTVDQQLAAWQAAATREVLAANERNLLAALETIRDTARAWEGRADAPFWNLGDIAAAAIAKAKGTTS